ncbi:MAG: branched-chain amino acid ABC transporter permease [Candidatus Bathyarchaeia archaeon]
MEYLKKKSKFIVTIIVLVIIALIAPIFIAHQTYLMHILILILLFATLAQSWNLLSGFAGQSSLGHAAFFGMGAYTVGLLIFYVDYFRASPWLGMILGGIIGSLIGLAIGAICFRVRGPYFALATLALTEVIRLIVLNTEFTQGALGISIPRPASVSTPFFVINFSEKLPYYYLAFVLLFVSFFVVWHVSKSRYGLMLQSIREDEDAAATLGVNPFRLKLLAMFISGFIAGVTGALYAVYVSYIDPSMEPGGVLSLFTSIEPVLITVIGGAQTIIGPIIGALVRIGIGEYLRVSFGFRAGMDLVVFGAIFIVIFFLARKGVWGLLKSKLSFLKAL